MSKKYTLKNEMYSPVMVLRDDEISLKSKGLYCYLSFCGHGSSYEELTKSSSSDEELNSAISELIVLNLIEVEEV